MTETPKANTDRELWRETEGDYDAPSIRAVEGGGIGIEVGGTVYVLPIRTWHRLAADAYPASPLKQPETF